MVKLSVVKSGESDAGGETGLWDGVSSLVDELTAVAGV